MWTRLTLNLRWSVVSACECWHPQLYLAVTFFFPLWHLTSPPPSATTAKLNNCFSLTYWHLHSSLVPAQVVFVWKNASISSWGHEVLDVNWWKASERDSELLTFWVFSRGGKFLATERMLRRRRREKEVSTEWAKPRGHGRVPQETTAHERAQQMQTNKTWSSLSHQG